MSPAAAEERAYTQCPNCEMVFRIPVRFLGHEARCTGCGTVFLAKLFTDSKGGAPSHNAGGDQRIGTRIGDYRVMGVLGRGGMGAVYEAMDTRFNRPVALKVLPPEMVAQGPEHLQRFLREGRLAATLHHPNVVNVFQVGRDGDVYFIAMELVRGGSASAFLKASGKPLSHRAAVRIIKEVARGLSAAQKLGIIHRDVKPANIMLGEHGLVKLADFGLAKTTAGDMSVTGIGGVIGTPSYMSPEQVQGQPADHRSDLYSLGATFYCLLVGRPPFYSENPATVLYRHVNEPVPDPRDERPEVPDSCVRIIRRSMEKDPDARFQTADQMLAQLEAVDLDTGKTSLGDPAMGEWLQQVARAQEGTVSDPAVFRKRRWEKAKRAVREWIAAGKAFTSRNRSGLVTLGIVAAVAVLGFLVIPTLWDAVGGKLKTMFGTK